MVTPEVNRLLAFVLIVIFPTTKKAEMTVKPTIDRQMKLRASSAVPFPCLCRLLARELQLLWQQRHPEVDPARIVDRAWEQLVHMDRKPPRQK